MRSVSKPSALSPAGGLHICFDKRASFLSVIRSSRQINFETLVVHSKHVRRCSTSKRDHQPHCSFVRKTFRCHQFAPLNARDCACGSGLLSRGERSIQKWQHEKEADRVRSAMLLVPTHCAAAEPLVTNLLALDQQLRNRLRITSGTWRSQMPNFLATYDLKETKPDPHSAFLQHAQTNGWNYWILSSDNFWHRLPNTTLVGDFPSMGAAHTALEATRLATERQLGIPVIMEKWIVVRYDENLFVSDVRQPKR
jgi:hypothetical protein